MTTREMTPEEVKAWLGNGLILPSPKARREAEIPTTVNPPALDTEQAVQNLIQPKPQSSEKIEEELEDGKLWLQKMRHQNAQFRNAQKHKS